ncbi:MAG: gamma-glutamylcyclotransferase [Actinocatenispora sp.]
MSLYAAYGSNLDPALMRERCPHSPQVGTGWLEGWRLTFGGAELGWQDGPLATVVEDPDNRVFVALYDLHKFDEGSLDRWEGVSSGLYRKLRVRVASLDGDVITRIHVLNAYEGGLPSALHVQVVADAAEKAGAPDDYVKSLRDRPADPTT